ncbi:MAG: YdcF family protein [Hyphomonadaceae bacterium]|nr:YdcF family protein [Hyphomonadaceae bacterium]
MREPVGAVRGDGAAALTGGSDARVRTGVRLVESAEVPRLLISGVNHVATSEQIRLVAGGSMATFACCVDLGRDAVDTVGNADEVATWVQRHRVKRLILITENYHMPRALFEVQRKIPDITIVPFPIATDLYAQKDWWMSERATRGLALEYTKYVVARARGIWSDLPFVGAL